ncbi:MAG: site-specific integrase [Solirubrobacterales bacterium]
MATRGRTKADGTETWLAHWREDNGRQRTKTFSTEDRALEWEAQKRGEKEDGILGLRTKSHETSAANWIEEWWGLRRDEFTLHTQHGYARVINKYLAPELGKTPLAQLSPGRVARMRDELVAAGESASAVGYAMKVLSSCLGMAVERDLMTQNPCAFVSKPKSQGERVRKLKWPLDPEAIELVRAEFLRYRAPNSDALTALRAATMTSVLAYAGLRTEEVVALKLGAFDPDARILKIEGVMALEYRAGDTKTHYQRVVELEDALVEDLELWIAAAGLTDPAAWLFPPEGGGEVAYFTHNNWAKRPWKRARDKVVKELCVRGDRDSLTLAEDLSKAMPKHLRSSYVSLLARADYSDADTSEMSGHSVEVLRKHYMGALRRMRRMPRLPVTEQIAAARIAAGTERLASAAAAEIGLDCRNHGALIAARPVESIKAA